MELEELNADMVYIYEGKVHYQNTMQALKDETNEKRLGKAIATMIGQKQLIDSINK